METWKNSLAYRKSRASGVPQNAVVDNQLTVTGFEVVVLSHYQLEI
jgi:hypothetical protein